MAETKRQVLKVRHLKTREVVHEVDVTGKTARSVAKVLSGMLINMSPEYFVDDDDAYPESENPYA